LCGKAVEYISRLAMIFMKRLLILFLLILLNHPLSAQSQETADYFENFALKITKGANEERKKVDAIFHWITDNIAYDTEIFKLSDPYPQFDIQSSYDAEHYSQLYDEAVAKMVLDKKKGICDGYARLFRVLCYYNDIECEVVEGKVRTWLNREPAPHAWNAVKINEKWYLADATWASGGVNFHDRFLKEKQLFYYLTPPERLFADHYPDDPKWTLLDQTYNYDYFINQAVQTTEPFEKGMINYYPKGKVIKVGKDGLIRIWIEFSSSISLDEIIVTQAESNSRASKSNLNFHQSQLDSIWNVDPDYFVEIPKIEVLKAKVVGNKIEYLIKPLADDLSGLLVYIKSSFPSLEYKIEVF
jgi:transglutaminase/protease-like cytokinesis protein 3